jgi:hypothetical protein
MYLAIFPKASSDDLPDFGHLSWPDSPLGSPLQLSFVVVHLVANSDFDNHDDNCKLSSDLYDPSRDISGHLDDI